MSTETGKDGYDCRQSFERRTAQALTTDPALFAYDARLTNTGTTNGRRMADEYWAMYSVMQPHLAVLRDYTVLELGSGFGRNAPFLSMFDCRRYRGVERQADRLRFARLRYTNAAVTFEQGDVTTYRGGRFGLVVTAAVMVHLVRADKLALLATVKASLAAGGLALLWESEIVEGTRDAAEARYAANAEHMIPIELAAVEEALAPHAVKWLGCNVWLAHGGPAA